MAQLKTTGLTGSINITAALTASTALIASNGAQFPLIITNSINNESEVYNSNGNNGATASADIVTFNDLGNSSTYTAKYYLDMGINSSGYTYPFIGSANDSYFFNSGSNSSSLFIGCIDTSGAVRIFAGGYANTSSLVIGPTYISATLPITGTFVGTASFASNSTSAAFAIQGISASFALNSHTSDIASTATTAATSSYLASINLDKTFFYHESYDFLQQTTASGQIDGTWAFNTGSAKSGTPEFNHPGILWLSASQILNQVNTFTNVGPSNVPSASIQLGNIATASFIIALSTGSYQYAVRFGLFDDITTETPANGIYFEKTGSPLGTFNTASQQLNNWIGVVRTGSVSRTITSSIASTASLAWHKFTIATSGNPALGTTASFYIDGTLAGTMTSSLTGSLPCVYGFQHNEKATVQTTGSAFATKIDYIEILGSCTR